MTERLTGAGHLRTASRVEQSWDWEGTRGWGAAALDWVPPACRADLSGRREGTLEDGHVCPFLTQTLGTSLGSLCDIGPRGRREGVLRSHRCTCQVDCYRPITIRCPSQIACQTSQFPHFPHSKVSPAARSLDSCWCPASSFYILYCMYWLL